MVGFGSTGDLDARRLLAMEHTYSPPELTTLSEKVFGTANMHENVANDSFGTPLFCMLPSGKQLLQAIWTKAEVSGGCVGTAATGATFAPVALFGKTTGQ